MGVKLVDIDNCIVFAKNRMKRRNSHTTVTSFFLGREKQKMSFENYFAVHSNKCYLVAHYLQLGLEHPWFGNSCLCYSIGHHGSERRHTSEHCAFHSVWQDEIADHFLQRLRYVMRSRDMSQPQHNVHWIGEMQRFEQQKSYWKLWIVSTTNRIPSAQARTEAPFFLSISRLLIIGLWYQWYWSTEKSLEPCVGFLHYSYIGKVEYTSKFHE